MEGNRVQKIHIYNSNAARTNELGSNDLKKIVQYNISIFYAKCEKSPVLMHVNVVYNS